MVLSTKDQFFQKVIWVHQVREVINQQNYQYPRDSVIPFNIIFVEFYDEEGESLGYSHLNA